MGQTNSKTITRLDKKSELEHERTDHQCWGSYSETVVWQATRKLK